MTTPLRSRPALAAVALGVAVPLAVTFLPQTSAQAEPIGIPQLYSGRAPSGMDVVDVQLFAIPQPSAREDVGDERMIREVDAEFETNGGELAVYADPDSVPNYMRSAAGVVDFRVFLTGADGEAASLDFSGRGVATDNAVMRSGGTTSAMLWLSPGESSEMVGGARTRTKYRSLKSGIDTSIVAGRAVVDDDGDDETIEITPRQYGDVALPRPKAGQDAGDCLRETYIGDSDRSTTIATSYPVGDATSWASHTSSKKSESTFGVAIGVEQKDGDGFDFSAKGSRFTSSSWSGHWEPDGRMRSYRIGVNYHLYALGRGCHGEVRYWRPHIETGGASSNYKGLARPAWATYCPGQPKNYTFTRDDIEGRAYGFDAAVKFKGVIGLDLSISREYTSSQSLSYFFPKTDDKHALCGREDYPSVASKMIDRWLRNV